MQYLIVLNPCFKCPPPPYALCATLLVISACQSVQQEQIAYENTQCTQTRHCEHVLLLEFCCPCCVRVMSGTQTNTSQDLLGYLRQLFALLIILLEWF